MLSTEVRIPKTMEFIMFNEIGNRIGVEYFARRVQGSGCGVSFVGFEQEKLIFDVEKFCRIRKLEITRCDFAVFFYNQNERPCCVLIELKSGALRASVVSDQLRGGAAVIEEKFNGIEFRLIPLVLTKSTHRVELAKLNKSRVLFRGIPLGIALGKCNKKGNIYSAIGKILEAY